MLIRAAVTRSKGAAFEIEELELEELRADEVLVWAPPMWSTPPRPMRSRRSRMPRAAWGADFSIDAAGSPAVLQQAVYCTGPGGVCCLIGAPPFGTEVSLDMNQVLAMGRTVRGIVEGESVPEVFLPRLIELWRQGRFPIDRIMTYYDFGEIDQAARDAEEGTVVQPVLRMSPGA